MNLGNREPKEEKEKKKREKKKEKKNKKTIHRGLRKLGVKVSLARTEGTQNKPCSMDCSFHRERNGVNQKESKKWNAQGRKRRGNREQQGGRAPLETGVENHLAKALD